MIVELIMHAHLHIHFTRLLLLANLFTSRMSEESKDNVTYFASLRLEHSTDAGAVTTSSPSVTNTSSLLFCPASTVSSSLCPLLAHPLAFLLL